MKRGDVYFANLDPIRGSEQAGTRPVLVLQRDTLIGILRTVLVAPFTSSMTLAKTPTCHLVKAGNGGLKLDSVLLGHQIRALDKTRLTTYVGAIDPSTLAEIEKKLGYTFDL